MSSQERYAAEKLMETMSPEMKEKYSKLSDRNATLQKTIDTIQLELDTIAKEKALLEQQITNVPVKIYAILYSYIFVLEL